MTFLEELALIGCYTDPHEDHYDGTDWVTPSLIDHDDGKEKPLSAHPNDQA